MDKYGVWEDDDLTKTADDAAPRCRNCGTLLQDRATTNVALCPKCGSEPYEEA